MHRRMKEWLLVQLSRFWSLLWKLSGYENENFHTKAKHLHKGLLAYRTIRERWEQHEQDDKDFVMRYDILRELESPLKLTVTRDDGVIVFSDDKAGRFPETSIIDVLLKQKRKAEKNQFNQWTSCTIKAESMKEDSLAIPIRKEIDLTWQEERIREALASTSNQ